jgi:hypothetical protein
LKFVIQFFFIADNQPDKFELLVAINVKLGYSEWSRSFRRIYMNCGPCQLSSQEDPPKHPISNWSPNICTNHCNVTFCSKFQKYKFCVLVQQIILNSWLEKFKTFMKILSQISIFPSSTFQWKFVMDFQFSHLFSSVLH